MIYCNSPSLSAYGYASSDKGYLLASLASGKTESDVWDKANKSELPPLKNDIQGDLPSQQFSYSLGNYSHGLLHVHIHENYVHHTHHVRHNSLHGINAFWIHLYLRSRSYLKPYHLNIFLQFLTLILHQYFLQYCLLFRPAPPQLFLRSHIYDNTPKALVSSLIMRRMF